MDGGVDEWAALEEPWRACLELAWESYRAGTVPVGAVVVDAAGAIVARGRNRIFDPPDGALAGTRLAHAEVDALAQLPSTARYRDHTLWSSLEPCLLCLGAALMSTVGGVRYLAADPYGGACSVELAVPDWERRRCSIEGPVGGWPGRLSAALAAGFWIPREGGGLLLELLGAETVAAGKRLRGLGDPGERFEQALPRLLAILESG